MENRPGQADVNGSYPDISIRRVAGGRYGPSVFDTPEGRPSAGMTVNGEYRGAHACKSKPNYIVTQL